MKYIRPSLVDGFIEAPASKSMMQRAIVACFLSYDDSLIDNATYCNDTLSVLDIIENLGSVVKKDNKKLYIKSKKNIKDKILNFGESGLGLRMIAPIAALYDINLKLTGKGSLLKRPINMVEDALTSLNVVCESNNGFLPLNIKGPIKAGNIEVDGSVTSQLLTGLLMALPLCENNSNIKVKNLKSKPYIDMTLDLLKFFGVNIVNNNYEDFYVKGNQKYNAVEYKVEGDWSGAAFIMVAAAIAGKVSIANLNYQNSKQADKIIMDILREAGSFIEFNSDLLFVKKNNLKAFQIDITDAPDLFPPLIALAVNCDGLSKIEGVNRLQHKESNRADTLLREFTNIGADIIIEKNAMIVKGNIDKKLQGGKTFSHNDHRIAMACAVAGLNTLDGVYVNNWEAVSKSYPDFFEDLKKIGAGVE